MPLRWMTDVAGAHLAIDDVDLDLAEPDGGHDGPTRSRWRDA